MRKRGFTLDQHLQRGFALKLTRDFILQLTVELSNAYPLTHKSVKHAKAALNALDSLKCELDDRVCEENPKIADEVVLQAYYGSRQWRGQSQVLELFERIRQALIEEEPPSPSKGKGGQEKKTPKQ